MLKPKTYNVLEMAVEDGVNYGVSRAFKHSDNPDHSYLVRCIQEQVMNSICEWFNIEEDFKEE